MHLSLKQQQFNAAMEKFNSERGYRFLGFMVSTVNVSLQVYLLWRLWPVSIGGWWQAAALLAAYAVTDFINGLVHILMDNNDSYDSIVGPLVANFHLHHKVPRYKRHNLAVVYFNETGSKVWLVGYLLIVVGLLESRVSPVMLYILVYVGILSSVAEVSHYLCHSSTSRLVSFAARIGLLLGKRQHASHHTHDNTNYAFLNGMSDPLLNLIAARWFPGYKRTTDLHFACYDTIRDDSR